MVTIIVVLMKQEVQLAQRGRATFDVVENLAKFQRRIMACP